MANYADYSDIIANVQDRFEDDSQETTDSVRKLLATALWDIYSRAKWKFAKQTGTITTADGTETYTLASDYNFGGLYDVTNTTSKNIIRQYGVRTHDSNLPATEASGSPYLYRLWGTDEGIQQIQLYPIPDGVYTVTYRYYRKPTVVDLETDTSNDGEEPDLPLTYRDLLVLYCLVELYKKDESALMNVTNAQYEGRLNQMKMEFSQEPDEFHTRGSEDYITGNNFPTVPFPSNFGPTS
jgi:hypothetical protein